MFETNTAGLKNKIKKIYQIHIMFKHLGYFLFTANFV